MRFHHVGYAVKDLRKYRDEFLIPTFAPVKVTEPVADTIQQVTVCFAHMQGGTVIELVEPLGEKSPVRSILSGGRGGLYHLCYEVDDLDDAMKRLRGKGCLPLGKPVPAAAFDGRRIVFFITPERDLIELLEGPAGAGHPKG